MSVTKTRSCTKGSVFLINYSLTILLPSAWHSQNDFHHFSFSLSLLLFMKHFVSGALFREKLLFCGRRMSRKKHRNNYLFILWISPQISLHLFRLFLGGCERVFGVDDKSYFSKSKAALRVGSEEKHFCTCTPSSWTFFSGGCCGWRWVLNPISKIYRSNRTLQLLDDALSFICRYFLTSDLFQSKKKCWSLGDHSIINKQTFDNLRKKMWKKLYIIPWKLAWVVQPTFENVTLCKPPSTLLMMFDKGIKKSWKVKSFCLSLFAVYLISKIKATSVVVNLCCWTYFLITSTEPHFFSFSPTEPHNFAIFSICLTRVKEERNTKLGVN